MGVRIAVKRILLGWVLLIILVALLGKVTVAATNAGRTAADFLTIGVGARAAGMGGAFTSVSSGAISSYWNPAGLTSIEGGEVVLGHFSWLQDLNLEHGTFAYSVSDQTTIAAAITYLGYGSIKGYDVNGTYTNEISAYDWAGGLSIGYKVTSNFSVGATGKFIGQNIDKISGSTIAADFGLRYEFERITLAGFVGNLGPTMKFEGLAEKLPSDVRIGVSALPLANRSLLAAVEIDKPFNGNLIIRHGLEFNFNDQYFLRTGYNFYSQDDTRSFGSGLTFGAGMAMGKAEFDYSYTTKDKYSSEDVHRMSLVLKFGR